MGREVFFERIRGPHELVLSSPNHHVNDILSPLFFCLLDGLLEEGILCQIDDKNRDVVHGALGIRSFGQLLGGALRSGATNEKAESQREYLEAACGSRSETSPWETHESRRRSVE